MGRAGAYLSPVLPRPPFTGTPDNLVALLDLCRLQSKQNWNFALMATPLDPVAGPTSPQPTNLVHRYLKVFGLFPGITWP